ncbi:YtxH domain-containing protein [Patescibacteria group bacterium]|nr:YtxH domain-containing protein [Patescibacteria group bacterium]
MAKKRNKFLWGMGIGAVLGILFAPRKGDDTRKKLSKEAQDLKEAFEKAVSTGKVKYEEIKAEVNPAIDDIKARAKPYVDSLQDGLEGKEMNSKRK